MKTRTSLFFVITVLTLIWSWNALYLAPLSGDTLWLIRQYGLYLTGQLAIAIMSISMILATRPVWLEPLFNGMDKIYSLHKWSGITGAGFAIAHWLFNEAGDPIADLIGKAGRPKLDVLAFMKPAHSFAEDIGEWGFYILLLMVAISMLRFIPYRSWRRVHKVMPVVYLILVAHAVVLMPASYWLSPNGVIMAVLMLSGVTATFIALSKRIGRKRKHAGRIIAVHPHEDQTLELICDPGPNWPEHNPGQFAFLTFEQSEGAHPFTISSAAQGPKPTLTFQIKNLGDYTAQLARKLAPDQAVTIEGPYGKFNFKQGRKNASQVWLAAGIGITPFIAWIDSLQNKTLSRPTSLHYVVPRQTGNRFVSLLEEKCRGVANLTLHVHDTSKQGHFDPRRFLTNTCTTKSLVDLWFCGPTRLANSLHKTIDRQNISNVEMHQEIFKFR